MKIIILFIFFQLAKSCKTVVVIHGLLEGPEAIDFLKSKLEEVYHSREKNIFIKMNFRDSLG